MEDSVADLGRDARAAVDDTNCDRFAGLFRGDPNWSARGRKAIGICQQVVENLSQPVPIRQHVDRTLARVPVNLSRRGAACQPAGRGLDGVAHLNRLQLQIQGISLDPRHVQGIADQRAQPASLAGDRLQAGAQLDRLARLEHPGAFRQDGRNRRPQVMRNVGEQLRAFPAGALQRLHLLLAPGKSQRQLGRLGLLPVAPEEFSIGLPQSRGQHPYHAGSTEEERKVDKILPVGNVQRTGGRDEVEIDQEEADDRRHQAGEQPARHCDHGNQPQVEKNVVALAGAGVQQERGQYDWAQDRGSPGQRALYRSRHLNRMIRATRW